MTELAGWLMLALILTVGAVAVYAALRPGRPGPKGDTGPCGPMGVMGVPGKPGECRCPTKGQEAVARAIQRRGGPRTKEECYGLPPVLAEEKRYWERYHAERRREAEAIRYRAVVHWDDREVIGYGPHQATPRAAERDGQECVDRHAANWYTVEQWTAGYWIELED